MIFENKHLGQLGTKWISPSCKITTWNFPNLKTFFQNEQTLEADCKKQAKTVFIIHPCDPTVLICYLIWPCDIDVRITYLISHSSYLSYNTVITGYFQVGCIINTKLPLCVDIIRSTSLGFHSWCPESTRPTDSCFQGTSCENLMMYSGLYQHTWVVCIFIIHPCDPTVVICYLIWPCDIAVCITYLISHSFSFSYNIVNKEYISGWVYNKYKTTLVC